MWNPSFNIDIVQIEKGQKNFTRFMFLKVNWNIDWPSYFVTCKLFCVDTLECRRNMYSVVFVHDLIHNNLNCSSLLAQLSSYSQQHSLRENFHFRPLIVVSFKFLNSFKNIMFYKIHVRI